MSEEHVDGGVRLVDLLSLTVPQAAVLSGLPVKLVRAAVKRGELASFSYGSTTRRILPRDLADWVESLSVGSRPHR